MKTPKTMDWILRFVKGIFVGSGFILPGVSGGAMAAVFGIYERLISFVANITKNFKENFLFFLPVGIGGVTGVFLFSFVVSYFFEVAEVQILWFFIGCIVGTLPTLWKQSGEKGRKPQHLAILAVTAVAGYLFLRFGESLINGSLSLNFGTWMLAGALMGLGAIVPGLSPSNFLVYLNLYKPMSDGIKNLDFSIILPIGIGGVLCVLALSKVMNFIFKKAYAGLFHFIIGIVVASTVMIIPLQHNYLSLSSLLLLVLCAAGYALGAWMCSLENKYKPADAL